MTQYRISEKAGLYEADTFYGQKHLVSENSTFYEDTKQCTVKYLLIFSLNISEKSQIFGSQPHRISGVRISELRGIRPHSACLMLAV